MASYERQDLGARGIAIFALAVTGSVVAVLVLVIAFAALFEERHEPPAFRPAAAASPRTLEDERRAMNEALAPRLDGIDRAMDRVLERGLPVGRQ